jgi:hypothetical protein
MPRFGGSASRGFGASGGFPGGRGSAVAIIDYAAQERVMAQYLYEHAGVPTDGTNGTYAHVALPGALLIDTDAKTLYQNTGTQASPVWTERSATSGGGPRDGLFAVYAPASGPLLEDGVAIPIDWSSEDVSVRYRRGVTLTGTDWTIDVGGRWSWHVWVQVQRDPTNWFQLVLDTAPSEEYGRFLIPPASVVLGSGPSETYEYSERMEKDAGQHFGLRVRANRQGGSGDLTGSFIVKAMLWLEREGDATGVV